MNAVLPDLPTPNQRLSARWLWAYWAYLVFVILFGAWVRITGSGAGCGSHWPSCHGQLVPRSPSTETLIEYSHRLTSGVLGIATLLLVVWVMRVHRRWDRVRLGALATAAFVVIEALIGAGIVRAELVADDASVARAAIVALHLVNTLVLTGAAGLLAHWSTRSAQPFETPNEFSPRATRALLLSFGLGLIVVSTAGAVTALGDTLFPVQPTLEGGLFAHLKEDLSASAHFLARLRIVHPVVAVVVAAGLLWFSALFHDAPRQIRRAAKTLTALIWAQLAIGVINVLLAAPGWMQLLHLLTSQLVWLWFLMLASELWERPASDSAQSSSQTSRSGRNQPQLFFRANPPQRDS